MSIIFMYINHGPIRDNQFAQKVGGLHSYIAKARSYNRGNSTVDFDW